MIDYGSRLLKDATISRFSKPLLLMHSRIDRVTDCMASVEFYGKLTTAKTLRDGSELVVEEDLGHEMHNEKCWRRIVGRWADWIGALAERCREETQAKG